MCAPHLISEPNPPGSALICAFYQALGVEQVSCARALLLRIRNGLCTRKIRILGHYRGKSARFSQKRDPNLIS